VGVVNENQVIRPVIMTKFGQHLSGKQIIRTKKIPAKIRRDSINYMIV